MRISESSQQQQQQQQHLQGEAEGQGGKGRKTSKGSREKGALRANNFPFRLNASWGKTRRKRAGRRPTNKQKHTEANDGAKAKVNEMKE